MILIGLGSNLAGKFSCPMDNLRFAIQRLEENEIIIDAVSSIWKTAPVPVSDQPWYYNAVCSVVTEIQPSDLLHILNTIEEEAGRVRNIRNDPRVLDLDILAYNNVSVHDNNLVIPHPRMHERAFVLCPLYEIVPDWNHPFLKKTAKQLIETLPEGQDIEKVEGFSLLSKEIVLSEAVA